MKRESDPRSVAPRSQERAKALHDSMNYSLGKVFGVPVAGAIAVAAAHHTKRSRRGKTKITVQPEEP